MEGSDMKEGEEVQENTNNRRVDPQTRMKKLEKQLAAERLRAARLRIVEGQLWSQLQLFGGDGTAHPDPRDSHAYAEVVGGYPPMLAYPYPPPMMPYYPHYPDGYHTPHMHHPAGYAAPTMPPPPQYYYTPQAPPQQMYYGSWPGSGAPPISQHVQYNSYPVLPPQNSRTTRIEDIAADEDNRDILLRIKENDPESDTLWVWDGCVHDRRCFNEYRPEGTHDLELLGYYIGKNTALKELYLRAQTSKILFDHSSNDSLEAFCRGVICNRSIEKILFGDVELSGGKIFQSLGPFFENNHSLSELVLDGCKFGTGCAHQLSLALKVCTKSLTFVRLICNDMRGEGLADIITALSVHLQLEKLVLEVMRPHMRTRECTALAALLPHTTKLHTLNLSRNAIDDEGVNALLEGGALINSNVRKLSLWCNNITSGGCQSLAALLENTNSNFEEISLSSNRVGDEGALIFANALAGNNTLKHLDLLGNHDITAKGWGAFAKVLCDTSSINNTFLSNHTLESFTAPFFESSLPPGLRSSLALNRSSEDKKQVAIKKILKHHQHFDMEPLFEWDMKLLPLIVDWFERALSLECNTDENDGDDDSESIESQNYDDGDASIETQNAGVHCTEFDEACIGKRKLNAIYQFIRAMPHVFEPAPAAGGKRKRCVVK